MKIPFVDLKAQYNSIKPEIDKAIENVINNSAFIKGENVEQFEIEYAKKYGVKHCISCGNGTDALFIAQKMLGIGPGDEVITTASSWISTSESISLTGAKPVFVDIEEDYFTIDPKKIEAKITLKTKAIIPVHLYGQCADMDSIIEIAHKYNLFIIEDSAQAHFAEYKGRLAGTMGNVGTFSFYPGKNLGAYGDAGAIITNDDELAIKMKMFANHGALKKHFHRMEGINSRMDGIQAAILRVKLNYINLWNQARIDIAQQYNVLLKDIKQIEIPRERDEVKHIYHVYCIKSKFRNEITNKLNDNRVSTTRHYPTALPFMEAYHYLKHSPGDFPVAYKLQGEILSLPIYPELTSDQIYYVCKSIRDLLITL